MANADLMGEEKIFKLLLKFALAAITGMIVHAIYNVVDRIFVGRGVGSIGIAAVTVSFPLMMVLLALAMLIGFGATALISLRLGEKKKEEAELIVGNGLVLMLIIAALITTGGLIFLNPLLKLFGASPGIMPYATDYLQIILWGSLFQIIGFGMNNFIRAEGNPQMAMLTMIIGAVLNIILNSIFIFGLKLGIKGAAFGTIISHLVAALWVMSYFLSKRSQLKLRRQYFKLKKEVVLKIMAFGSPSFSIQIAACVVAILFNNSLAQYGGDTAIAVMGIINSVALFLLMPVFGVSQGAQPIIGYNYGAKKFGRVIETLKIANLAATVIVLIGFVLVMLFPVELIRMFNSTDRQLVIIGTKAMRVFFIFLPILGLQIISASYFQAAGKPLLAMLLSLSRQVLFLIPALLILPRFFALDGIFYAEPIADLLSSIITVIIIYLEMKNLKQKNLEELALEPSYTGVK